MINDTNDTKVNTKEVITPNAEVPENETAMAAGEQAAEAASDTVKETAENLETKIPKMTEAEAYYQTKQNDHDEIVLLIGAAEKELADLKLRKSLMEADFSQLLAEYNRLIVPKVEISTIAKKTLLEYFSYELLKPLLSIGLKQAAYDTWETKHFLTKYELDSKEDLMLQFKINPVDQRFTTDFMSLMTISPKTMQVTVNDPQVLELIRLWHAEKVFSMNQLSLVNYDLNQLLNHFRDLGFAVNPSLLDNTQALHVALDSEFPLETQVLDDIFVTAMENKAYDFEKTDADSYQVLLDQNQKIDIRKNDANQTNLFINSEDRKRSILDFFVNYPFLVPLMVREV